MAQRDQSPTVTLRCPVCNERRDAALHRKSEDDSDTDANHRPKTGVRCAACGQTTGSYHA